MKTICSSLLPNSCSIFKTYIKDVSLNILYNLLKLEYEKMTSVLIRMKFQLGKAYVLTPLIKHQSMISFQGIL